MNASTIVNSVGLAFDMAGVVMLFYFGPPTINITRDGRKILPFNPNDDAETHKNKVTADRHNRLSKVGLGLLLLGFTLQLISNFVP